MNVKLIQLQNILQQNKSGKSVVNLKGDVWGRCPPGVQNLSISWIFGKIWQNRMLAGKSWHPHLREILDQPVKMILKSKASMLLRLIVDPREGCKFLFTIMQFFFYKMVCSPPFKVGTPSGKCWMHHCIRVRLLHVLHTSFWSEG